MVLLSQHYFQNSILIMCCTIVCLLFFFTKRVRLSKTWKATVTPLASIIGSGFLVVTPLYILILGKNAFPAIIVMVFIAYLIGYVMRFNICHIEPVELSIKDKTLKNLEHFSFLSLSIAYLISVPFYIKLLSLFLLRGIHSNNEIIANCIATGILAIIGVVGKLRGFKRLEFLEEYSVNIKLAIIISMLIGLIVYNLNLANEHSWELHISTPVFDMDAVRKLLGTIIIVQGFETSRFLSLEYDTQTRVNTMRYAQIISGIIYVAFVGLAMVVFNQIKTVYETSIIDVSYAIAIALPYMLIVAAILSQFSAAIADTLSAGGLLSEASY